MRFKILFAASLLALNSGCVTFSGLDPHSNYSDIRDGAIIVMGISPRYRIHVFEGERIGEKWKRDMLMTKLNVFPEDGYVVARLPARTGNLNYGIGGILPDGIGGKLFSPCKGRRTLTFEAPSGKVVYVGDIKLAQTGSQVRYEASSDFEAARSHLKIRYPLLAERLEDSGSFENPELANVSCGGDTGLPIIIYQPRPR